MALYVKRPVVVKNVVTENFKKQMIEDLCNAIKQIEIRLGQIEFRGRRIISDIGKTDQRRVSVLQEELNQEREKQGQLKEELEYKLAEIEKLQIDQVFVSGVYDSPVKIEIGDKIMAKLSQAEIIVKDGVVIQIRE
jgi:hypothetical protein